MSRVFRYFFQKIALLAVFMTLSTGHAEVVINEIMYHPYEPWPATQPAKTTNLNEYVEIYNDGTNTVDLSDYRFDDGIDFNFPFGQMLAAGAYLVVPLYGETCPRCLVGSVADTVMYPLFWIPGSTGFKLALGVGTRGLNAVNLVAKQMPTPFASDSEWDAYKQRMHDRHGYSEAKRLFYENLELDVED